jgi:hypothetical protein
MRCGIHRQPDTRKAQTDKNALNAALELAKNLVDELRLMVHPVALGAGERLFGEISDKKPMRLLEARSVGDGLAYLPHLRGRPGACLTRQLAKRIGYEHFAHEPGRSPRAAHRRPAKRWRLLLAATALVDRAVRDRVWTYLALGLGDDLGGGIVECDTPRPVWLPYVEVANGCMKPGAVQLVSSGHVG